MKYISLASLGYDKAVEAIQRMSKKELCEMCNLQYDMLVDLRRKVINAGEAIHEMGDKIMIQLHDMEVAGFDQACESLSFFDEEGDLYYEGTDLVWTVGMTLFNNDKLIIKTASRLG